MGNSVDLENLRENRLTPVVKSYVQVLNKLCELPDLKDDWERHDNLISNDAENDQIKTIQNEIFERNKSFILSGSAGMLGTHLSLFWDDFWTLVLQTNRENGSVLEPDDENISGWTQTDTGTLRDRIRDNEDEALEYLKVVPAFSEEAQYRSGESIRNWIRSIPPFHEINPRDLRNQLLHNSKMDRNFDQDKNKKKLFVDPAYLKLGFTDYQRMVEICFKIISEDFSKSQIVELNRKSELEEELTKKALYSNSMMKSRIKNLEWDPETYYVDPSDDGMTVQNLANKIERNTIVQLFGIGGLGKTVLAYKYILENLDGEMKFTGGGVSEPIEPYDSIFFLSSKDWPQGEQDTVDYGHESDLDRDDIDNRKNPRSGKNSAARFHKDGKFEFFIDEICAHSPQHYVDKDKQTKAYEYIRDNHILIVLDNFEDVQDYMGDEGHVELEKYTQFFNRFRGNEKGKIIITTRQQYEGIGSTPFELKPVSKRSRVPLIKNRAEFLAVNYQVLMGQGIREWIFTPSGDERIELFDQVAGELGEFFEQNLGYPHVIFAFTRLLMDKSRDIGRGVTTENLIHQVATEKDDDGRSFRDFVQDQWEWSIKKGFTPLKKDEVCMAIIEELWKTERGVKFESLCDKLSQFTLSQHRDAIKKLNLNGVFIETDSGRDSNQGFIGPEARIRLKAGARYYLGEESETSTWKIEQNTEPLSNPQKQDLELLRQLDSAINKKDEDGINKILGRLLKDDKVRLSRRKPVHQGITDFACRLLEELKKNASRGADKYSIPEDSIQGFEIEVLNACIALSKQEGADKSKFIDRALRIIEASDETDISHLGELYQPIIQQLWEGDEAENLTPNKSPPTWAERLARLLAKPRFQPGIDNGGIELMYEWVTICDALDSSNSISKYDERESIIKYLSDTVGVIDKYLEKIEDASFPLMRNLSDKITRIIFRENSDSTIAQNTDFLDFNQQNLIYVINCYLNDRVDNNAESWKSTGTGIRKFDSILVMEDDVGKLDSYFGTFSVEWYTGPMHSGNFIADLTPIPKENLSRYIDQEKKYFLAIVWNVDKITQKIESYISAEVFPERVEQEEVVEKEDIGVWLDSVLTQAQQKGSGFIRVSELGSMWREENSISLKNALKKHGVTPSAFLAEIAPEKGYLIVDKEEAGGRIRKLADGEDPEMATYLSQQNKNTVKWLNDWPLPESNDKLAESLISVSDSLSSNSWDNWVSLRDDESNRFRRLIYTQAINSQDYSRNFRNRDLDISPIGLLENMVSAIRNRSWGIPELEHQEVEVWLNKRSGAVFQILIYNGKDEHPIYPSAALSRQREERVDITPGPLMLHSYGAPKEVRDANQRKIDAKREYGPIVDSRYLISDYVAALSKSPQSDSEFRTYVNENYRMRVKSSRTRVQGIKKSDEQIWDIYNEDNTKEPLDVVKELLTRAGLKDQEIEDLLSNLES